jgi:rhomboid protease GluP
VKRNATTGLITLICGFYLLELLAPSLQEKLFLVNRAILSDGMVHGVGQGEWYRIFTVVLVHAGFTHLAFNMWALFVLGNPIEQAFGRTRFLTIFLISLIAGSSTSLALAAQNQVSVGASVGASGAIFGLFGAFAVAGRKIGADVRSIFVLIGINFALDFIIPHIDWHAHLGGLIGGAIAATFLLRKRV